MQQTQSVDTAAQQMEKVIPRQMALESLSQTQMKSNRHVPHFHFHSQQVVKQGMHRAVVRWTKSQRLKSSP